MGADAEPASARPAGAGNPAWWRLFGVWPWCVAIVVAMVLTAPPPGPPIDFKAQVAQELARRDQRERDHHAWSAREGDQHLPWDAASGHLAIVIDDIGRELRMLERLQALPIRLTFSILPGSVYARGAQLRLRGDRRRLREIWLHFPMQPLNAAAQAEQEALGERFATLEQTDQERISLLTDALDIVRTAVGVNNHMGSALTANAAAMRPMMVEMQRRRLLFLDSRTTADSVAQTVASEQGVTSARRHVFLDHDPAAHAVAAALDDAISRSRTAPTIAIGHPSWTLIEVLESRLGTLKDSGVVIYPLSELVAHGNDRAFPPGADRATLQSPSDVRESETDGRASSE